jgi:exonuclease III
MDFNRFYMTWKVLDWNIRGINSEAKQLAIREKIEESCCDVICVQETKRASFDHKFIHYFCPKRFDNFAFSPSVGAYGGILVVWNSSIFF